MGTITPEEYLSMTGASYSQLADTIGYPYDTVKRWFQKGKGRRNPDQLVCKYLAQNLELERLKNGDRTNRNTVA